MAPSPRPLLLGPWLCGAIALAACGTRSADPAAGGSSSAVASASASEAEPAVSARRPIRRYYLDNEDGRCDVYFLDGEQRSAPQRTPCPMSVEPGERLRIAGKTCMRESVDPAREIPVVCPDPLTNLEKRERKKQP